MLFRSGPSPRRQWLEVSSIVSIIKYGTSSSIRATVCDSDSDEDGSYGTPYCITIRAGSVKICLLVDGSSQEDENRTSQVDENRVSTLVNPVQICLGRSFT